MVVQDDDVPACQQQDMASSVAVRKTVRLQQQSEQLKERLMVSEATVQAQAEQLKDFRELLSESTGCSETKTSQRF